MKVLKLFGHRSNPRSRADKKVPVITNVAIFGYANVEENQRLYKNVVEVGKALAEAGYTVVDGGGPGVMEAASVGAKEGGGKVIGVTLYPKDMSHFEGRDSANHLDQEIKTTTYVERTLTLLKEGQVYVIFNGGTGTISEFGMAWGLARLYFGHHKPLILYGKFWKKILKAFKDNMLIRPEELKVYKIVDSPDGVLEAIARFQSEIDRGEHGDHLKAIKSDFQI